jgi:hypothetical protein
MHPALFLAPSHSYGADGALGIEIEMVKGNGKDKMTRKGKEDKSKGKVFMLTVQITTLSD